MKQWIVTAAIALTPGMLYAQDAAQSWPGLSTSGLSTIYVQDDTGLETEGKFLRLNPDSIVLLVDGAERRFEAARVRRIQKRGDSVRNGAIIGAVFGAVFGGIGSAISDCPGDNPGGSCAAFRITSFALSTAVDAAVGAGIDALAVGRTTLYSAAPRARAAASPASAPPRGPAIGVTFRW